MLTHCDNAPRVPSGDRITRAKRSALGNSLTLALQRSPSAASSTSITSSDDSFANISDMVTYNSTLTAVPSSDQAMPMKSTRVREPDPDTPYGESSLTKAEAIQVEVLEELTHDEERDRHRLELRVEQAFYQAGKALSELRERRLYRSTHKTFEAYCRDRFNYSRDAAYLKIAAAEVYDNIQKFLPTIGRQIPMPTTERQLRDLAKADIEPEMQASAWVQSVDEAGGRVPSGRIVKGIVEQLKEKTLVLAKDFCQVGDVFTLVRLEGKERKYNGCWAIAVEPRDFTVLVDVHDASLTVKPENMDKIDSPDVKRQLPQVLQRIRRVREVPGFRDRVSLYCTRPLGTTNLPHAVGR